MLRRSQTSNLSASLHLLSRLPRKVAFLFLSNISFLTISRVLLATIHDNGLCPCPRCLMQKTYLDRMGWIADANFRIKEVRRYLHEKVKAARDLVHRLGHAVASAHVNDLLKPTSSVPTLVSEPLTLYSYDLTLQTIECLL